MNSAIDLCFPSPDVTIIAEPGRYFVTSAYTLACPIHSKRNVYKNGKLSASMYYLSDGVYGTLSDHLNRKFVGSTKIPPPVTLKPDTDEKLKCTIWGPTCDAMDQVNLKNRLVCKSIFLRSDNKTKHEHSFCCK